MKHRLKILYVIIFLGIFMLILHFGDLSSISKFCGVDSNCKDLIIFGFKQPLYIGVQYILLSLVCLLIFSEKLFKTWFVFFKFFMFVSLLFVIFSPVDCNAPLMLCFDKVNVTKIFGALLLILTILILIIKSIYLHYSNRNIQKTAK